MCVHVNDWMTMLRESVSMGWHQEAMTANEKRGQKLKHAKEPLLARTISWNACKLISILCSGQPGIILGFSLN